jgi:uncharacterized membrane protein YbhN (UPF0104 family)
LWITLASLTLIGVALVQQSAQLRQQSLDSQGWWWLLLGLGLTWLSILINGLAWRVVLGWLGSVPEDLAVVPLFVRSNLLKYLPGGIWHLVERVRLLRPSMGGGPALAGVILDPLLIVAASGLMLMAGGWQNGLVLLAPIPALMLLPRWREPILQRLERSKAAQLQMAGDQPLEIEGSGRSGYPWSPLAAEITFVVCRFSGFFCCVQAFNLAQPAPSQWLAAFGLAYAIGLVVPGAPGGLGVFEATLLVRLGGGVSEAPLLAVVLSYRLISTLADVLAVGSFRADRSIAGWLARRN